MSSENSKRNGRKGSLQTDSKEIRKAHDVLTVVVMGPAFLGQVATLNSMDSRHEAIKWTWDTEYVTAQIRYDTEWTGGMN